MTNSNTNYPLNLRGTLLLAMDCLIHYRRACRNCADDLQLLSAQMKCEAFGTVVTHILGYCPGEAKLPGVREVIASGELVLNEDPEDQTLIVTN